MGATEVGRTDKCGELAEKPGDWSDSRAARPREVAKESGHTPSL